MKININDINRINRLNKINKTKRIRLCDENGKYIDEYFSSDNPINFGTKLFLNNVLYNILDVIPFIAEKDVNDQEYIKLIVSQ